MSSSNTDPRAVASSVGEERTTAVLLLAGHALRSLARDRPRVSVVVDDMELGRDSANDSWSAGFEDPFMSRRHARIARGSTGEWFVSDLESTNGTWVDGRVVPAGQALPLALGSVLMLGGHVFVFRRVTSEELTAIHEDWS